MTERRSNLPDPAGQPAPRDGAPVEHAETPGSTSGELQGRKLGEFQLLRRLGRGGMAEVWLAEQTSLKRQVAIKVLRRDLVADPSYLKRFQTEAMAAAALNHPNIVQVYAVGADNGMQFIAQEYVQGQNLREFLSRKGPPDLPVSLHIMRQVALALQVANEAGIVHRDIKPENIMINRKGEVKVADFGLAQLSQGGERVSVTISGMTMGTPLYMSPEQVNGSKLDQRSDIYSFGVTCYHMLTGAPPFRGETAFSVALQHLNNEPAPLQNARPDLPPLLLQLVHKMMAKKADDRYPTAQAVLKEIKRIAQERSAQAAGHRAETAALVPAGALAVVREPSPAAQPEPPSVPAKPVPRSAVVRVPGGVKGVALSLVLAALAGMGAGWAARPANPLRAPVGPPPEVEKKETAALQYWYAAQRGHDDEAAWKAVGTYFPDATLERRRAEEQLALLYLRQSRLDQALRLFDEFAADKDPVWRAFGLAGQVAVHSQLGNRSASKIALEELNPLMRHLTNPRLKKIVDEQTRKPASTS